MKRLKRSLFFQAEVIVPQDAVEDDGVAKRTEGQVGGCEAMTVELGVLDKDGSVGGDRLVCRHIQLPRRQVVDTFSS
jgi:hypothetical protein